MRTYQMPDMTPVLLLLPARSRPREDTDKLIGQGKATLDRMIEAGFRRGASYSAHEDVVFMHVVDASASLLALAADIEHTVRPRTVPELTQAIDAMASGVWHDDNISWPVRAAELVIHNLQLRLCLARGQQAAVRVRRTRQAELDAALGKMISRHLDSTWADELNTTTRETAELARSRITPDGQTQ